ncbi:hypothetical protein [Mesobacillus subterraneus]|uniref:Uncharacterized protein n=1 Tax=Mesobacillus subterraneus TaxID=285983 RepID=A0A427TR24_9BACI|nr:hypothetical protein [Mesobacillus subterraneus]RSD26857.1 hypothetical protein EJA10_13485 [Mesobacillus subterraneus]
MGIIQGKSLKEWRNFLIATVLIIGAASYYQVFFKPKNSLELYQAISFAEDFEEATKLTLEGYENNFKEKDFDYINRIDTSANSISQFTLFEYDEKTYVIMTSPGTERLKVLAVEELPADVRDYFLDLAR